MEVGEEGERLSLHCHHQNDSCIKPVLNWVNVCSRTYLEVFGEPSWFLFGRTFLREPSWKYSSNCDEAIFGVQKASLNVFWEHSPYSTNIASDWLTVDEEDIKIKMDDGVAGFFTRFTGNLFNC